LAKAKDLSSDPGRLVDFRSGLRARLKTSPIMSFKSFAEELGKAYRRMWRAWCQGQGR
jgi:predicted O-linked N-acetylglucosamine transferase (SPINDLY family)